MCISPWTEIFILLFMFRCSVERKYMTKLEHTGAVLYLHCLYFCEHNFFFIWSFFLHTSVNSLVYKSSGPFLQVTDRNYNRMSCYSEPSNDTTSVCTTRPFSKKVDCHIMQHQSFIKSINDLKRYEQATFNCILVEKKKSELMCHLDQNGKLKK